MVAVQPYLIVWIRAGVGFLQEAANSWIRLEHRLGQIIPVNSSYRDAVEQMQMYRAWQCYVAGNCAHPGHSRALHPDESVHCAGLAVDTDAWRWAGFLAVAAEYGWIQTAAWDPTEQHHLEYQAHRDQHRNEPVPPALGSAAWLAYLESLEEGDEHMRYLFTKDSGGNLWTLVNTATGEIVQTREQHIANTWAIAWGSAKSCDIQSFLNALAAVKITTDPDDVRFNQLRAVVDNIAAQIAGGEVDPDPEPTPDPEPEPPKA
jgi:hypothetical protein